MSAKLTSYDRLAGSRGGFCGRRATQQRIPVCHTHLHEVKRNPSSSHLLLEPHFTHYFHKKRPSIGLNLAGLVEKTATIGDKQPHAPIEGVPLTQFGVPGRWSRSRAKVRCRPPRRRPRPMSRPLGRRSFGGSPFPKRLQKSVAKVRCGCRPPRQSFRCLRYPASAVRPMQCADSGRCLRALRGSNRLGCGANPTPKNRRVSRC